MEEQTANTGLKQHLSPWLKWLIVVVGVAVVFSLGYFYSRSQVATTTVDSTTSATTDAEEKTATASETTNTFTDTTNKFSFIYPKTAYYAATDPVKSPTEDTILNVTVYNIKTMTDEANGYTKESLASLKSDLISGAVKTARTGMLVKDTIDLAMYEICDIQFTRTFDIFNPNNDTLVSIKYALTSVGELKAITANSSYFKTDSENCSGEKAWDEMNDMSKTFRSDVIAGKTATITKQWYSEASAILTSFEFSK